MAAKKAIKKPAKKSSKPKAVKAVAATPKLKPIEEAFAENYVTNGGNATDAARKAGVRGSKDYVRTAARRMITKDHIQKHIHQRTRERLKGVRATADELYFLLADHLRADLGDLQECFVNGRLDLQEAKKRDLSRLIRKIKIRELGTGEVVTEIEIHDSQSAAFRLAQLMGLQQQPRQNDDDVARVKREIALLVSEGWEPERAREIVIQAEPAAARWLN